MDLDDLRSVEEAQPLKLVHPETGIELEHKGKPMVLRILGPDTPKMQALERAVQARRLKSANRTGRFQITIDEVEAELYERLATAIVGWDNIVQGGTALPYSHEAARTLMRTLPWMRDQVDEFYRDRGNFLAASVLNSKPH